MDNVRHARESDIPRLIELGRTMHDEAVALKHAPYDAQKVEHALRQTLERGLLLVHIGHDGIDGAFAGIVVERWFSRSEFFTDLALFVDPDRRGGLAAYRLLRACIAWCKERGLDPRDVQLGVSTGVHPEQTGRLYEKLKFDRYGGLYRLREF